MITLLDMDSNLYEAIQKDENCLREEFSYFTFKKRVPVEPRVLANWMKTKNDRRLLNPDVFVRNYWRNNPHPGVLRDPENTEFAKPTNASNMEQLKRFNTASHSMPDIYKPAFQSALTLLKRELQLPKQILFANLADLARVEFKNSKHPGIHYKRQGFNNRGEAHPSGLEDAREAFLNLMDGKYVEPHDVFLRGVGKIVAKAIPTYEIEQIQSPQNANQPLSSGRIVLMLSHRDLLLLRAMEQKFTAAYCENSFPIAFGQKWSKGGPSMFINKIENYETYHCLDASKFDSSISGWLVMVSIDVLRAQVVDGQNKCYDAYWKFVYDSMVDVTIQRFDGLRMQKHKGTTTGNSFNTLIQSIITLLLGYTAIYELTSTNATYCTEQFYMESLGDDSLICLKGNLANLSVESVADVVYKAFGIDWRGKKSFSTNLVLDSTVGDFKGIKFLGKYFWSETIGDSQLMKRLPTPYHSFQETLESLYYPTHFSVNGVQMTYGRVLALYLDAAGNIETEEWLQGLLQHLKGLGAEPQSLRQITTRENWLLFTHLRLYKNGRNEKVV